MGAYAPNLARKIFIIKNYGLTAYRPQCRVVESLFRRLSVTQIRFRSGLSLKSTGDSERDFSHWPTDRESENFVNFVLKFCVVRAFLRTPYNFITSSPAKNSVNVTSFAGL